MSEPRIVYKSAITGEFITKEEYDANPDTTVALTLDDEGNITARDREHVIVAPSEEDRP